MQQERRIGAGARHVSRGKPGRGAQPDVERIASGGGEHGSGWRGFLGALSSAAPASTVESPPRFLIERPRGGVSLIFNSREYRPFVPVAARVIMGRMPYSIRNPGANADRGAATLKPTLSLFDSATIVAGSMIGSGIFIVSADIVRHVQSPAALLSVWIVAGLMTIAGALAYGELAAMMPYAGGQYVFLREAYGGLPAFMFGWTLLLVIQTGTIAAVAVAFARFTAVFWPALGGPAWLGSRTGIGLSPERLAAIAVIIVLTAANLRGLDAGRFVQNLFTSVKALSLVLIVTLACLIAPNRVAIALNFDRAFFAGGGWSAAFAASFGAAMVGALFPPMPGRESLSPPLKSATRAVICRGRSRWAPPP